MIERTLIFRDDRDRDNFLDRLGGLLLESSTPCYAWSLLCNHTHFLLRRGKIPIAVVMRKLLTGYAVTFNRRYGRDIPLGRMGLAAMKFYLTEYPIAVSLLGGIGEMVVAQHLTDLGPSASI